MNINENFELVKEILGQSFCIPTSRLNGVDVLKKRWQRNKKWLFPYFDENGRKEIKVDSTEEFFTKDDIRQIYSEFLDNINKMAQKEKYSKFVYDYPIISRLLDIIDIFEPEELVNNRIITTKLYYPDTNKEIPPNTKISKFISILPLREFGYARIFSIPKEEELVREFINMAFSLFIEFINATATIVLSINPLDYVLMSAHTTGWRSCHHFVNGCFKTGGFSYMCDKESVVAYAYSSISKIENTDIKWPVKKWRQMVFFDKNSLCAMHSRQYPYNNSVYERMARKLSAKVLCDYGNCPYKWYVRGNSQGKNEVSDNRIGSFRTEGRSSFNYTDPVSSMLRVEGGKLQNLIKIGTAVIPCILCGSSRRSPNHDTLICRNCRW